jgi:uncharacterized protein YjdB
MTFKHKLSARLARLWCGLPLAALLATASCEVPARDSVGPGPGVLDRVQLSPPVVTVAITAMTDFVAVGMTAAGDTVPSSVSWSVTGGQLVQSTDAGGRHLGRYQAGSQPGNYRVIVTASAGSSPQRSDTASVIVTTIPVTTVLVSPASVALDVGQNAQLAATPQDANGLPLSGRAIVWTSANTAVATISGSGLVTARAAGSTTVTATSEGISGSASVTVTQVPVASVEVTPASASIAPGGTVQLAAVAKDGAGAILAGRPISWSTSSAQIATVAGGLVTGVAAGTAQIVATAEGKSDTATITVAVVPVASVEVTPASASIGVGSTVQLTAVAKDGAGGILSGRPMTWSSSSVQIATVAAGLVTGVAAGTAYIVASSEGKSDTATITVTFVPVASVTVSPDVTSVAVDGYFQFTAILKDAAGKVLSGRAVTWSSDNTAVATVSASGLAHGVATGTATITAQSEGITGSAALTVVTAPPVGQCGAWPAGITQWIQPLAPSTGQAFYASPTGSDANPGTLAAPWRSLSKANSLQPGQILYLRAGTYGARGTSFDFSTRGTAVAPITVSGYPGDGRPLIQGRLFMSGDYLRLTNVIIDGPTGDVGGPGPSGEAITIILKGSFLELSNSEVRFDQWHAGVGVDGGDHYIVMNNYIHDNGGYLGDFTDDQWNTSHGMYNSPSSYGLVANNVIEHNDAKGLMGRHDAHHIMVVNNTVVANGRYGIDVAESTHDWILANNILLNNGTIKGGGGIGTPGSGGTTYVQINNLFWNNGTNGTTTWDNNATIINNKVADPMLVNPAVASDHQNPNPNTDNQLRAGSPAIGFADRNLTLPFDITGKCRGTAPDAGAYQR